MKKVILLLLIAPYLLAIRCFDDECQLVENWEEESYVQLVTITPLQTSYSPGDKIILSASIPANNNYFGESVNILEESGDETGLLQLISVEGKGDLFLENEVTIKKGTQGRVPVWFEMEFNNQTGNYELEVEITLNRTGAYTMVTDGSVDFGSSDCPDYKLNFIYKDIEGQFLEFSVGD
ncbi:MAG: hypothetical protein ACMZ7B_10760 [Balneola sp.]